MSQKKEKEKEGKKKKEKKKQTSLLLPVACLSVPVMESGGRPEGDRSQEVSRPFKDILIAFLFTCKFTLSNRKKEQELNPNRWSRRGCSPQQKSQNIIV